MSKNIELKAEARVELGKRNQKLRLRGLVPAVIYGKKFKPAAVSVESKEFTKLVLRSEAGRNLIFNLKLDGEDKARIIPVKTQQVQFDPLTDAIMHIDFMHIVMDEAIRTKVPIELRGVPVGVKDSEGVLVHGLRELEIKCLPGDIPDKIEIDVSNLAINHSLQVADLKVGLKIEVLTSPTMIVATVKPPTKEEEVAPALTPEAVLGVEPEAAAAEKTPAAVPVTAPAKPETAGKETKADKAPVSEKKK